MSNYDNGPALFPIWVPPYKSPNWVVRCRDGVGVRRCLLGETEQALHAAQANINQLENQCQRQQDRIRELEYMCTSQRRDHHLQSEVKTLNCKIEQLEREKSELEVS